MSNLSFQTKKKTGYNDSHFVMNHFVAKQETWNEETMKERTELLMKEALDIWRYPETSYEPEEEYSESFTLANEDFDATGKKIIRFSFHGQEEPTKNWVEMYQRVLRVLYSQDPSFLNDIVLHPEEYQNIRGCFGFDGNYFNNPGKLTDKIWIEKNLSTNLKLYILRYIFKLYGEDPENLAFYLADQQG